MLFNEEKQRKKNSHPISFVSPQSAWVQRQLRKRNWKGKRKRKKKKQFYQKLQTKKRPTFGTTENLNETYWEFLWNILIKLLWGRLKNVEEHVHMNRMFTRLQRERRWGEGRRDDEEAATNSRRYYCLAFFVLSQNIYSGVRVGGPYRLPCKIPSTLPTHFSCIIHLICLGFLLYCLSYPMGVTKRGRITHSNQPK